MKALKNSLVGIPKVKNNMDDNPFNFGCDTCYIWQNEVRKLKAKVTKALQRKLTFAIDSTKFNKSLNPPYTKYSFFE